jgi:dTDP-glucose 4,6-dehydratase
MNKILVTGGFGFIGSNLIKYMLEKYPSLKIINIDSLTYAGKMCNLGEYLHHPNLTNIIQDIRNINGLENVVNLEDIDGIIHLAAESHVDNSIDNPNVFLETNVMGTVNLLNLVVKHKIKRFHHVSTDEVYGSLNIYDPPSTEESLYKPRSPYSASKASSDHFVESYGNTYGVNYVITNCSNNFGPNQHDEKLLPTVIRSLVKRKKIPVYGEGTNIRDWLYVIDHCEAIDRVFRYGKPKQKYNIGGDNEMENLEIIDLVCDIFDELTGNENSKELKEFVTDRPGHDFRYSIDHTKITKELLWSPSQNFKENLKTTIQHYIEKYGK